MLNSGGLNRFAINSLDFKSATGSGSLVKIAQYVAIEGVGALVNIAQKVDNIGSGSILGIQQDVHLNISGVGALISIVQNLESFGSGSLIGIEQFVQNNAIPSFYTRNGWDLIVSLGGYNVPSSKIQEVQVTHSVNDDSRATVKLNPGSATYNLYSFQGQQLIITARTSAGFARVFTGIVDIPSVQVVDEKITLEGISDRETLIRNNMTPYVDGIGYYSTTVFGPLNNVYQEVTNRMETIPYDLDFDPNGNWTITSWTPKGSADITLTNSDLYREQQPTVGIKSTRDVVNKVVVTLKYAYQRLHQSTLSYTWASGLVACDFLTTGNTLPTRSMVQSAAGGAGWKLGTISFDSLWPSGFYQCGGTTIGWVNTRQDILIKNSAKTASGSNMSTSQTVNNSDLSALLCLGSQWNCKKRFTQNVEESYTLTVNSPQSQALYGIKEKDSNLSLQAKFDAKQWEDETLYDTEFAGTKIGSAGDYYINEDNEVAEFGNCITTALNKARTEMLASHKDTEVEFTTVINPSYQLRHTIALSATRISAKGKVKSIVHKFTADGDATSTVKLALYRAIGSTVETSLVPPARPTFVSPVAAGTATLQSRWGQDPSSGAAKNWNGYTGNKWVTVGGGFNTNTYKTTYQESFVVDTPAIPESRRNQQNYTGSGSYNISIPSDSLTITFVDS